MFVPKHPVINPKLEDALKMEERIDYEQMINEAVEDVYTIKISDSIDEKFKNLL